MRNKSNSIALPFVDLLKFAAVTAVIVIHVAGRYRAGLTSLSAAEAAILLLADQASRFSVPLFVGLSGFGLMLGYGKRQFSWLAFFRRRVLKLLPWYLFFATVIILAVTYVFHENLALYDHLKLWRLYFLGKADIHLYFVPMILQLYLLFPVFLWLFRRIPNRIILLAALVWQIAWYVLITQKTEITINNNGIWPDQTQYLAFQSWEFYFILGMYLAQMKPSRIWLWVGVLASATGLAWMLINSWLLLSTGINLIVATRFTRLPVLLYASGWMFIGSYLIDHIQAVRGVTAILVRFGQVSYITYLLHTLVLRAFFRLGFIGFVGPVFTGLTIILVSFLLADGFDRLGRKLGNNFTLNW